MLLLTSLSQHKSAKTTNRSFCLRIFIGNSKQKIHNGKFYFFVQWTYVDEFIYNDIIDLIAKLDCWNHIFIQRKLFCSVNQQ